MARGFWVGSYTENMGGTAQGIGLIQPDDGGALSFSGVAATVSSPSYLLRSGEVLYATDEATGAVSAYTVTEGDVLEPLGVRPTSGPYPCHLSVHGGWLYVSNYGDGSIDVFPVLQDGSLGELAQTLASRGSGPRPEQEGPHAHSTLVLDGPDGVTVLSADLGTDRVHVHRWQDGALRRTASLELPAGTGPRDLLLAGSRIFLLGEFGSKIFEFDGESFSRSGELVSDRVATDQAAGLAISDDGNFLYSALRGSNRIAVVDAHALRPLASVPSGGDWPRHLGVFGQSLLVANQLSSTVARFSLDVATGIPTPVGVPLAVPSPTFLLSRS